MKGFSEHPSFMLEFESNEKSVQKFKEFANQQKIKYTAFENKKKKTFQAVVDRKWEEVIYKFVNDFH